MTQVNQARSNKYLSTPVGQVLHTQESLYLLELLRVM